jgi:predicted RNA-binding Zn ribbon-like protein
MMRDMHGLRRVLSDVLRPIAHSETPPADAVETFNGYVARAAARRQIDPVSLTWRWIPPRSVTEALSEAIIDAADLITRPAAERRLRFCPACGWLFDDTSRNGQRRWCDMADCGSRAKARAYYNRKNM